MFLCDDVSAVCHSVSVRLFSDHSSLLVKFSQRTCGMERSPLRVWICLVSMSQCCLLLDTTPHTVTLLCLQTPFICFDHPQASFFSLTAQRSMGTHNLHCRRPVEGRSGGQRHVHYQVVYPYVPPDVACQHHGIPSESVAVCSTLSCSRGSSQLPLVEGGDMTVWSNDVGVEDEVTRHVRVNALPSYLADVGLDGTERVHGVCPSVIEMPILIREYHPFETHYSEESFLLIDPYSPPPTIYESRRFELAMLTESDKGIHDEVFGIVMEEMFGDVVASCVLEEVVGFQTNCAAVLGRDGGGGGDFQPIILGKCHPFTNVESRLGVVAVPRKVVMAVSLEKPGQRNAAIGMPIISDKLCLFFCCSLFLFNYVAVVRCAIIDSSIAVSVMRSVLLFFVHKVSRSRDVTANQFAFRSFSVAFHSLSGLNAL